MSINYSLLACLTSDEVTLVKGVFTNESRYDGKQPKEYTYKTTRKDLAKDDLCVVQCIGESAQFGFAVIKLTKINVEVDVSTIVYNWLVDKLELEDFNEKLAAEEALISKVKNAQKVSKKQQLLAALDIADNTHLKLSDFRAHGFKGI